MLTNTFQVIDFKDSLEVVWDEQRHKKSKESTSLHHIHLPWDQFENVGTSIMIWISWIIPSLHLRLYTNALTLKKLKGNTDLYVCLSGRNPDPQLAMRGHFPSKVADSGSDTNQPCSCFHTDVANCMCLILREWPRFSVMHLSLLCSI